MGVTPPCAECVTEYIERIVRAGGCSRISGRMQHWLLKPGFNSTLPAFQPLLFLLHKRVKQVSLNYTLQDKTKCSPPYHKMEQGLGRLLTAGFPLENFCPTTAHVEREIQEKVKSFHAGVLLLFLPPVVDHLEVGGVNADGLGHSLSLHFFWAL